MDRELDDWLENYLRLTQNLESPTQYNLWSGIVAIASCLQRKCWVSWGLQGSIYPNLYVALVGPPGGRKGTSMKIAKKFVQDLEVTMGSDSVGSIQALYNEIKGSTNNYNYFEEGAKEHKSLSVWSEEFQVFLSDNNGLIGGITDLFDCPNKWKYSSIGRGEDDLSNCWLTLFGAITPSLLQNKLSQDAVGGGLISRILFVVGYGKIKKVAFPYQTDEELVLQGNIMADLEQIKNMAGPFRLTEKFHDAYSDWYNGPTADAGVDSEKFVGYNQRRALHAKKLCMIISASESNDMVINTNHLEKAIKILEYTEHDMPNAFYGLGRGFHSDILSDLMRYLQTRGEEQGHIGWHEIVRRFQLDAIPADLTTYLGICEQTKMIRKVKSTSNETVYELLDVDTAERDTSFMDATLFRKMDK